MVFPSFVPKDVEDIIPYYTSDEHILYFPYRSGGFGGLFAIGMGDHVCFLCSFLSLFLFLPPFLSRNNGFFSPFPFFLGGYEGYQHRNLLVIF